MPGYRLPEPRWESDLRRCCLCSLVDNPVYVGEADVEGHPIFDHRVVIDLAYIKRTVLSNREKERGWQYMKFEGRDAKVRTICRTCLQNESDNEDVWRDFERQRQEEADESKPSSYYAHLCSE